MNRGYIRVYRKLMDSRVFQNEGLLKVWLYCLLSATHREEWVTLKVGRSTIEVHLVPGQFVFGRHSAAKKLRMSPSTVWKRILKLKNLQKCDIKSDSHYSIITIIKLDTYQPLFKKGDSKGDSRVTAGEQPGDTFNNNKNNNKDISSEISSLKKRYTNQNLIDQVFSAIASTRKYNRVKDSILLSQLQKWGKYPVHQVESGIKTYLGKDYAGDGKDEKYLLGIIRNSHNRPEANINPVPAQEYDFEKEYRD